MLADGRNTLVECKPRRPTETDDNRRKFGAVHFIAFEHIGLYVFYIRLHNFFVLWLQVMLRLDLPMDRLE